MYNIFCKLLKFHFWMFIHFDSHFGEALLCRVPKSIYNLSKRDHSLNKWFMGQITHLRNISRNKQT